MSLVRPMTSLRSSGCPCARLGQHGPLGAPLHYLAHAVLPSAHEGCRDLIEHSNFAVIVEAIMVEGFVLSCRGLGRGVERRVHGALVRALGAPICYEWRSSGRNAAAIAFVRSLSATDTGTQGELAER